MEPAWLERRPNGMNRLVLRQCGPWSLVLLSVVLAGCTVNARSDVQTRHHARPAARVGQPETFLAVVTRPAVYHHSSRSSYLKLIKYQVNVLQLRSVRTGRVIKTLLRSLGDISALRARDGSVTAVVNYGCRSRVLRIDPSTGRSALIRTLPQYASGAALSPDGTRLAYLTYPASTPARRCSPAVQPATPVHVLSNPGGLAQFLPNVVAVVNLASGATVRAATRSPGSPPFALAWSPDGKSIAVDYSGDWSIVLLSAAHPDFASAPQIRPPHRCGYIDVTWAVRGLLAVLGCNRQDPGLSPRTLVRLSATGHGAAKWKLPACIDGVHAMTDTARTRVLVESDVGYGNGPPCAIPHHPGGRRIEVAIVGSTKLRTIAVYRQNDNPLSVTGW